MLTAYISLVSLCLGMVVWAVRLEGRVNTGEQKQSDLKELILSKLESMDENNKERFERLERLVIKTNGNGVH